MCSIPTLMGKHLHLRITHKRHVCEYMFLHKKLFSLHDLSSLSFCRWGPVTPCIYSDFVCQLESIHVPLVARVPWVGHHWFNFSFIGAFMWLTLPRPYRATTCWERELTLDHIHTFLTTQGHGGPPRTRDQLQHKHERWYTPSTYPFIPTSWIWKDDNDGLNDIQGPCGPKASLWVRENFDCDLTHGFFYSWIQ